MCCRDDRLKPPTLHSTGDGGAVADQVRRSGEPSRARGALSEQVAELGPGYQRVLDFGTFLDAPMAPAFTRYAPPEFLRPSGPAASGPGADPRAGGATPHAARCRPT